MTRERKQRHGWTGKSKMEPYIAHITLSTGHIRRSPRSEVGDDALAVLVPWLEAARAAGEPIPLPAESLAHYSGKVMLEDGALLCTIYGPGAVPLVTFGVAQRSRQGEPLWELLAGMGQPSPAARMPSAPWCGVVLHPSAVLFPDAMEWLGDLERCVAWAWITRKPDLRAAK